MFTNHLAGYKVHVPDERWGRNTEEQYTILGEYINKGRLFFLLVDKNGTISEIEAHEAKLISP